MVQALTKLANTSVENATAVGGKDTTKMTVDSKRLCVIIVTERDTLKQSASQVLSLSASGPKSSSASNKKSDKKKVKPVDTDNSEDTDDEILMVGALGLHSVSDDIIWITPQVDGQDLKMEVNTGSAVSIISYAEYKVKFGAPKGKLKDTSVKLKTYTGERVTPIGTVDVNIKYKGQTCTAPLYILSNEGTTLFR